MNLQTRLLRVAKYLSAHENKNPKSTPTLPTPDQVARFVKVYSSTKDLQDALEDYEQSANMRGRRWCHNNTLLVAISTVLDNDQKSFQTYQGVVKGSHVAGARGGKLFDLAAKQYDIPPKMKLNPQFREEFLSEAINRCTGTKTAKVLRTAAPKKPLYMGVFLEQEAMDMLKFWFEQESGATVLPVEPKNPHLTSKFKPSLEEVRTLPLGTRVKLTVTGWAADSNGQAVTVRGFPADNMHPHVTLATVPGVSPVYSNELLTQGFTAASGPTVEGTVGYFDGNVQFSIPV